MLKNIIDKVHIFHYICYICKMKQLLKASELDGVLNQLKSTEKTKLSELEGNINLIPTIIKTLEQELPNEINVDRRYSDPYIWLSPEGEKYKNLGGYSYFEKREQKQKWKNKCWNALCYILGIVTGVIGQYVLFQLTHSK